MGKEYQSSYTFPDLEECTETKNSKILTGLASWIYEQSDLHQYPSGEIIAEIENRLIELESLLPINALAIEGIRGSGKTTQISLLEKYSLAQSGSRIITPLYSQIIKPRSVDVYMTMFGGKDRPIGGIIDTLLVSAFHADRLARIQAQQFQKPLLVDRHWLSFFALETTKMIKSGIEPTFARKIAETISTSWNQINKTIILNCIGVEECETRIRARGDTPRSEVEMEIDRNMEKTIEDLSKGVAFVPKFFHDISFVNAKKTPDEVFKEIIQAIR